MPKVWDIKLIKYVNERRSKMSYELKLTWYEELGRLYYLVDSVTKAVYGTVSEQPDESFWVTDARKETLKTLSNKKDALEFLEYWVNKNVKNPLGITIKVSKQVRKVPKEKDTLVYGVI